jgi:hypothetical protein
LEQRKIGSDGKRIHTNIENKNKNICLKKEKKKDYPVYNDYSDDYEKDSFIDDSKECPNSEVEDFFSGIRKRKEIQKKNEYKGDIVVSNYDEIQKEEEFTRREGRREDLECKLYNKEHEDDEEDDDDEDY